MTRVIQPAKVLITRLCLATVLTIQTVIITVVAKPVVGYSSAGYPLNHGFGKRHVSVVTLYIIQLLRRVFLVSLSNKKPKGKISRSGSIIVPIRTDIIKTISFDFIMR